MGILPWRVTHPASTMAVMENGNDITITCVGGQKPSLRSLSQYPTYEGLLDGAPCHKINQDLLDDITRFQGRTPIYLVPPTERPGEPPYETPFGPSAYLPRRRCRGLFDLGGWWLEIVWFQDSWAPPIDPAVLAHLQDLDFMALAFDEVGSW